MTGCRFWVGSDTNGHVCGAEVHKLGLDRIITRLRANITRMERS